MSGPQALLTIVGALYLVECIIAVPGGYVAFRGTARRWWVVLRDGMRVGTKGRRLCLVPLVPGRAGPIVAAEPMIALGVDGIALREPCREAEGPPIPWEELEGLEASEDALRVRGRRIAALGSPALARHCAGVLAAIRRLPRERRESAIDCEIARSLNVPRIDERLALHGRATAALAVDTLSLFILVFVLAPLMVTLAGWDSVWPVLVLGVIAMAVLIVGDVRAARSVLYPRGITAGAGTLLTIALSPASAMRARDALSRELLVTFHPLAVARVLCASTEYMRVVSGYVRGWRRTDALARAAGADEAAARQDTFERRLRAALEAFIADTVEDAAALDAVPERRDPDAVAFCPACLAEFAIAEGQCQECGGVPLEAYAPASSADA